MTPASVRTRRTRGRILALLASGAAAACSTPFGGSGIDVTIAISNARVEPGTSARIITVTAQNTGSERVVWGMGSSSCQLHAVVQTAGSDRRIDTRACTEDLVEQGLDGGDSRIESWEWEGGFFSPDTSGTLRAGTYEIRGVAGDEARSSPLTVEIVGELLTGRSEPDSPIL